MKIKIYEDLYLPEFIQFMRDNKQEIKIKETEVEIIDTRDLSECLKELINSEVIKNIDIKDYLV